MKCDLSSDNYSGLDRFGRVSDMVWWQYGNSGNLTNKLDEFVYWHLDTEGDITGKVAQAQNMSQVQNGFGYDAMGRLTSYSHQIGGGTAATSTSTCNSVGNNINSTTGGQYDLGNKETHHHRQFGFPRLKRGRQHANPQHGQRGDLQRLGPASRGL